MSIICPFLKETLINSAKETFKENPEQLNRVLHKINQNYSSMKRRTTLFEAYFKASPEEKEKIRNEGLEALLKRRDGKLIKRYTSYMGYDRAVILINERQIRHFFHKGEWRRA